LLSSTPPRPPPSSLFPYTTLFRSRPSPLRGDLQHQPGSVLHGRPRLPEAPGGDGDRRALTGRPDAGGAARRDRDPAAAARGAPVPVLPGGGASVGRGGDPDPRLG